MKACEVMKPLEQGLPSLHKLRFQGLVSKRSLFQWYHYGRGHSKVEDH